MIQLSIAKTKWKILLTIAVVAIASFGTGVFANMVNVGPLQSLAGNQVLVPAPELQILSSSFSINLNTSSIVAVTLNVTTVGGTTTQFKLYQIFVQLSCLRGPLPGIPGTDFICAVGTTTITLPTNMNGVSTIVKVPITPAINPELIEVHNLGFIVTGTPAPAPCTPSFTITAKPSNVSIVRGTAGVNVTKTVTSTCGFTGSVSLTATGAPVGLTAIIVPAVIALPANGSVSVFEVISASIATVPGVYKITNCGTGGSPPVTQCTTVIVNVI